MRKLWILVASALLAFANFVKSQETARNLYSSRYDNLDIDTILGSTRLVNNYVDCLLSRKPCPPEGKDLKRILPEALRTKCGRCSTTQKENALKIISTLYLNYPDQYQSLRERWDPTGEYNRRFEEYLRELQFNQIGSNGNGDRPGSSSSSTVPSSTTVSEIGGSGSGGPPSDNNPGSRSPGGESQQTEANFNPIAAAGSEPNVPNNTSPPPATNPTSTSLSVAIDSVSTESTINLGNRFGFDNEDGGIPMAMAPGASGQRPGITPSTARPTTTAAAVTARMTTRTTTTTTTTRRPAPAMTRPPQTTSSRQTTTTAPRTTTTRFIPQPQLAPQVPSIPVALPSGTVNNSPIQTRTGYSGSGCSDC
ncbi:mucin-2-like isoform X2 [Uranotaenia lowii]|uniref:mucin-2-like isoform X2 n=1 Tax=Uranotaenia lowii TaxID=190385 RepID=UPI00247AD252|nr:mucin-2-like isoform X2 [Uranotaenia lowii]